MTVIRLPRAGYGYGCIHVDNRLMNTVLPDAHINETTTQGELRTQGTLEQCKQALLLPEDYEVIGIYFRYYLLAWDILIESPDLPMPSPGEEIRSVMPIYRNAGDKMELVRIEVTQDRYHVLRVD